MRTRPNIVLIVADDHRYQSIGANGESGVQTPHLDALSARGAVFEQAHCQGSMHPAVCVPCRASLMTGRNIFASAVDPTGADYGGQAYAIPPTLATFPERLRAAGYRTHAVGKWHNDAATFARSFGSGERLMFGGMSDHDRVPLHPYDPAGIFPAESVFYEKGFSTDLFREAAVGFLEKAPSDRPFCLYVAFTAPHDPRTPPAAYAVDPAGIGLPPNAQAMHPFDNGDMLVRDEQLEAMPRPADAVRRHLADYYGMIAHLDAAVGRILEALAASGHAEDTIVVYTADHGLALGQHGLMGKQSLYEHSLRVPLILSGPGIPAGRRHGQLVWHADTCATLLDQAGLDPDPASEGRSLLPVLRGDGPWERRTLAAGYRATQRMMRDERYKLICYFPSEAGSGPLQAESPPTPGSRTEQLFDLAADPWETVNLACVPELRTVRDRLAEALARWQAETGDPFLDRCT